MPARVDRLTARLDGPAREEMPLALVTSYSKYLHDPTVDGAINSLAEAIALESRLAAIRESVAGAPLAPGKWSRKEILGHLIDSAGNNLQRFVRAQIPAHLTKGELRLAGYSQDDWVRVQGYSARPWEELVCLWTELNRHLFQVLKHLDRSRLATPCVIGERAPMSLEAIVVDYVGHLKHHLAQILEAAV